MKKRKTPDLEKYLEGKKRRFVNYTQGAKIYKMSYVTNSGEGEGLLFYGTTIIPFKDKFDKNLKLYSLMTTKPEEVEKREKEMEVEKHEGNR